MDNIINLDDVSHPNEDKEEQGNLVILGAEGADAEMKTSARRKAIFWPPLEKQEGKNLVFPFLDRNNCDRDFQLCSVIAMQQVFISSHGTKSKVWDEVRSILCGLRTKDDELLFPDGINSINTLRRRTDALMRWTKKYRDSAAVRSGTDNEVHSNFIALLENLLEQKESLEEEVAGKVIENARTCQRKASEAEVLRLAAMSTSLGRKRLHEVLDENGRKKGPSKTAAIPGGPTKTAAPQNPLEDIVTLAASLSQHSKVREEKIEIEKEKQKRRIERDRFCQEMKAKKLDQENQTKNAVFAMIQQQQEAKNESNEIQKTMVAMMQQQRELLIVLKKIVEK